MKPKLQKTYSPKPGDLSHDWFVVDAADVAVAEPGGVLRARRGRGAEPTSHAPVGNDAPARSGWSQMVKADWIKPGAVVIDVGTSRVDDPSRERGYRVCGDVLFDEVKEKAAAISPVPGGVGPMTITMLLYNTVESAKHANGID